jgi:hypothetical protein
MTVISPLEMDLGVFLVFRHHKQWGDEHFRYFQDKSLQGVGTTNNALSCLPFFLSTLDRINSG